MSLLDRGGAASHPPGPRPRLRRSESGSAASLASLLGAARRVARRDPGEVLRVSLEALGRYKVRTALSVLGVVLGVAAVIAMMSVTEGARREAMRQVASLGLDNVVARQRGPSPDQIQQSSPGLTFADAEALRELVPHVARVAPLIERYVEVGVPGKARTTLVLGTSPEYRGVMRLAESRGRFLAALDIQGASRVCVLGQELAEAFFGYRDPLGQAVRIQEEWYTIVGVLADRAVDTRGWTGSLPLRNLNESVLVPVTSLARQVQAKEATSRVDEVWVQLQSGDRVVEIGRVIASVLGKLHHGAADFDVVIPRELLQQRYRTQRTFGVVVGSVALLSLLVGGIGIMNIMLASVLERTHEIGIRRAVGATRRDVAVQFLTESLAMTLAGGAVGVVCGVLVSWAITAYAGWATSISTGAVFLALLVSITVGLTFGFYPARQAARLDPIDALRYE